VNFKSENFIVGLVIECDGEWLPLLLGIPEVLGLNLGLESGYPV
jgi:hypothetical protein